MEFQMKINKAMNAFSLDYDERSKLFELGEEISVLESRKEKLCTKLGAALVEGEEEYRIGELRWEIKETNLELLIKKEKLKILAETLKLGGN